MAQPLKHPSPSLPLTIKHAKFLPRGLRAEVDRFWSSQTVPVYVWRSTGKAEFIASRLSSFSWSFKVIGTDTGRRVPDFLCHRGIFCAVSEVQRDIGQNSDFY